MAVSLTILRLSAAASGAFDIRAFGATGDGRAVDSPAINHAIEAASAAGGGTVRFPAGTYLSGSIRLRSNVTLYLDAGATLLASDDDALYDPAEPNEWGDKLKYQDFGHSHWRNSLIWGEGLENITISNCVFEYSCGLALETVDGALLEDVTITNITMRDIINAPIFLRIGARMRGPEGTPVGSLRRVTISNLVAHNVAPHHGILIAGLPDHPIEDLTLSNIFIDYQGGGTGEQAERLVPEYEKEYPEPGRFGTIPSYGMFARHVKGLTVHNFEVRFAKDDLRPAVVLDDVADVTFDLARLQHLPTVPGFVLKNVSRFSISHSRGLPDTRRDAIVTEEKL